VTCADRYFAIPPDGDTPRRRLAGYVGRLLDIVQDIEAGIEHTRRRLQ
jgi:hypothetical protein